MLERLFESVSSLGGPFAYLAVAALAAGESSLGVGLVVPGETGMIVGGVIVSQGNASFGLMWLVAFVGAVVGDSVGYEIGRRLGPRIRRTRVGRAVGEERWQRAETYLRLTGGRAVFLGRFVAVVRSLVPAVAGISRMPYSKFLFWNATGALLWSGMYVTVGYAAGRSYEQVADRAEGAGYILLGVAVVAIVIAMSARWAIRNQTTIQRWGTRVGGWKPIAVLHRYFGGPMRFVRGRFRLDDAFGLSLTAGLVALVLSAWAAVTVASAVARQTGIVELDVSVARWFADHRVDWLTSLMRVVTDAGSFWALAPILGIVAAVWLLRTGRWGVAMFLAVALVGAVVAGEVVKDLVERQRPPVRLRADGASGFGFPSGHSVQAMVAYGSLAYIVASAVRSWAARVAVWTAALVMSLLVGFSRVFLGVHWMTDVLGAYALAAAWLAFVITAFSTGTRLRRRRVHRPDPTVTVKNEGGGQTDAVIR